MKVLFDHQIFDSQPYGGISRYFFELFTHFDNDDEIFYELPLIYSNNIYLKGKESFSHILPKDHCSTYSDFLPKLNFRGKNLLFKLTNKFIDNKEEIQSQENKSAVIKKIKKGDFDVFHPTYYDNYFLEYIGNKPFVITVYDLIHQIFPELGLFGLVDKNNEILYKAAKIIAISESTKSDLINIFNIPEEKIEVTYLASSIGVETERVSTGFKKMLPKKYFLFIGKRDGYKNFLFFIQMFSALGIDAQDTSIVCSGNPFTGMELKFFDSLGVKNKIFQVRGEDYELSYLYKNAIAMVFPSMYEGFGLPVLEAFNCGCPVLVSNTSSLAEIGGDAVIYFDPKSPSSLLSALKNILINHNIREKLIAKGYIKLKKFNWEKTTSQTKKIYKSLI